MLLVFDIANTNIKFGIYDGDKLKATWRISTGVQRMADEYAVMLLNMLKQEGISPKDVTEGAMSCVVPPLLTTFNELFYRYFNIKPLAVGPGVKTGVRIRKELGEKAMVVATGGYADIIAQETKAIDKVNPNLTLYGVKVIHDMNRE